MAKINLLPWREELRKQKKKDFITAIGISVLVTALLFGVAHNFIEGWKEYQAQRNEKLQKEIAVLDKKLQEIKSIEEKKTKLLAKIRLIQKLQESRPEIVHLFAEVAKTAPEGIYLTKITQKGDDLVFEGRSQSNARISAFMRAIEASPWLQAPTLTVIESEKSSNPNDTKTLSVFMLHAKQGTESHDEMQPDKKIDKDQKGKT